METEKLYTIGQIARLFHLSTSTLHHYERQGLLKPESVDPDTGYRYYGYRQFEVLNTVQYLRTLGFSLESIRTFLDNRSLQGITDRLQQQLDVVQSQILELKRVEAKITSRLSQIGSAASRSLNTVSDAREKTIVMRLLPWPMVNPSSQDLEIPIRRLSRSQPEAVAWIGKIGLGISKDRLMQGDVSSYDFVFLVLDDSDRRMGGEVVLPESRTLTICFHGTHIHAAPAYRKLFSYMKENHLKPAGFAREITLVDQGLTSDESIYLTEIRLPVCQADQ